MYTRSEEKADIVFKSRMYTGGNDMTKRIAIGINQPAGRLPARVKFASRTTRARHLLMHPIGCRSQRIYNLIMKSLKFQRKSGMNVKLFPVTRIHRRNDQTD